MTGWFLGLGVLAVIALIALFGWAFLTVVSVMENRLGLSQWESFAILVLASFIFGSSGASTRSKS